MVPLQSRVTYWGTDAWYFEFHTRLHKHSVKIILGRDLQPSCVSWGKTTVVNVNCHGTDYAHRKHVEHEIIFFFIPNTVDIDFLAAAGVTQEEIINYIESYETLLYTSWYHPYKRQTSSLKL